MFGCLIASDAFAPLMVNTDQTRAKDMRPMYPRSDELAVPINCV
jgi:hypothetical protein